VPSAVTRSIRVFERPSFVRAWGPAIVWLVVLFMLSHQTGDDVATWWSVPDTVAHLGLYIVLGAALAWGRRIRGGPSWPTLGLFGVAWAASDEWHQSFVPGRDPSAGDLLADVIGLLLGGACAALVFRILPSPRSGGPATPIDAAS